MSFNEWIKYAEEDLDEARNTFFRKKFRYACYFSQQSVEKYLKAFIS